MEWRDPRTPACPRAAFWGRPCHPAPPGSCFRPRVADLRGPDVPACISGCPPTAHAIWEVRAGSLHAGPWTNSLSLKVKHQMSLWLLPRPAELRRPQATQSDGGAEGVCREDRPACFSGDGTVAMEELNRPTDDLAGELGEVGCRITQVCAGCATCTVRFVSTGSTKQKTRQKMPLTVGRRTSKYPSASGRRTREPFTGSGALSLQPDFTSDGVPVCSAGDPGAGDR